MKKIALMCDSAADIAKEEAERLHIHVLRMPLIINGKEYIEEETITDKEIIDALQAGERITTAQPSIGEMINMWDALLETHDEVFYLPLSRELSGTCGNAITMAEQYKGRVTVVDSEYACYPIVVQLLHAREMFEKGYSSAEVKKKLETESSLFAILIPETLTTLKNGGRLSPAAAALAGMLKIHPLLNVDHGSIGVQDKVRTISKAYKEGIRAVLKDVDPQDYTWMVIDADNRKQSDALKKELEELTGQPVEQHSFKAVIMSHTGPGTIGFGRIKKIKY